MGKFSEFIVNERETIRDAFRKQTSTVKKFLLVVNKKKKVLGIVTDGDFRRAILASVSLEAPISSIMNKNFHYFEEGYNIKGIKKLFYSTRILQIPVLKDGMLSDIIFRDDFKESKLTLTTEKMDLPVVIMAGGVGKRLDPFTRILPKPLIPIGNKAIIEIIMDYFAEFGMKYFFVSVNHMANMIKAYFEYSEDYYKLEYIEEDKPLGTIGALYLIKDIINTDFFVTNCDILVNEDYSNVYDYHKKGDYIMTILGSMQHHRVPYGVMSIKDGGELNKIIEKPEYDFLVNTGMYVFSPKIFNYIPENKKFDITNLIEILKKNKEKIGVYPVSENSWLDVGQWDMYNNSMKKIMNVK